MTASILTRPTAPSSEALRPVWLVGTLALTVGVACYLILAGEGHASSSAVRSVVFIGSGMHVAATAWFFTVPEVRRFALQHPRRYVAAPILLIVGTAALYPVLPSGHGGWILAPYLAWQFWHYQKQNVGMSALANVAYGSRAPRLERHCIVAAGGIGIVALFASDSRFGSQLPWSIEWLYPFTVAAFIAAVVVGLVAHARRPVRSTPATLVYLMALGFFAPVFVFGSALAAVTSFAVAHGYQYLLIVGLVAGAGPARSRQLAGLATLLTIAVVGGLALDRWSRVAVDTSWTKAMFGAYLGVVMSHFVIDAGLWRLRDEFPRSFLSERLPYLLRR